MGWVRGQTGQKKERKAKERLSGAGVWRDPGRGTLVGLRGRLSLGALPFTRWEKDPICDPRRSTGELPVGSRVGAAQGHPASVEGGEGRARGAGVLKGSRAQGCTNGPARPAP